MNYNNSIWFGLPVAPLTSNVLIYIPISYRTICKQYNFTGRLPRFYVDLKVKFEVNVVLMQILGLHVHWAAETKWTFGHNLWGSCSSTLTTFCSITGTRTLYFGLANDAVYDAPISLCSVTVSQPLCFEPVCPDGNRSPQPFLTFVVSTGERT